MTRMTVPVNRGFSKKTLDKSSVILHYWVIAVLIGLMKATYKIFISHDIIATTKEFFIVMLVALFIYLFLLTKTFYFYMQGNIEKKRCIKGGVIIVFAIVMISQFYKNGIENIPVIKESPIVEEYYDAVKTFRPSSDYSCGFRKKEELPCSPYAISKNYTWVDPEHWWKGIYRKEYLEKNKK